MQPTSPTAPTSDSRSSTPALALALLGALAAAPPARAGGTPENAVLIVDPSNPESLYVANYYRAARGLPAVNVVYMSPTPGSYSLFVASTLDAFLGSLENLRLVDHADYAVLPPGGSFYVDAPGLVADQCYPVNRFSSIAPFVLARESSQILGGTDSMLPNGYASATDVARAFDATVGWTSGVVSPTGSHYFIGAMLGYTGSLGNTLPEVLAMIDRSVAVDGTFPSGTFYFMHTSDPARSGPRDPLFPAAVASILAFGGNAQLLFADLPLGNFDCLGIMTGLSDPNIDGANLGILSGAFCDHLTSYAATFDSASQTKMSRWISKGASGTSGTVEEPCNYPGKFVSARLHVFYRQGLSLGESWFRSLGFAPFQTLFVGDPLTRPFAYIPVVGALDGVPSGSASGTLALTPHATTSNPNAHIASFDLLVDGVKRSSCVAGGHFALDTTALADGPHEWRVLAYDDTPVKSAGRGFGTISVSNHGRTASLSPVSSSGDLRTRFDFNASASGGTVQELRLLEGSRVVAASAGSAATLSVCGQNLGAGTLELVLEAEFSDGVLARSAPVDVSIAYSGGAPGGHPPVAYGYTKHVLATQAAVVELPASFDDDLSTESSVIVAAPAQAAVIGGSGPYRILRPNAGASGTDSMSFQVTTGSGTSSIATVTLVYDPPITCATPTNYCVTSPNSAGPGAVMGWAGSTSLGANDLQLYTYGCPSHKLGIYLYGTDAAQIPLGNGFRCVASPFHRLASVTTNWIGDATYAIDFTAHPVNSGPGEITIGSTQRFQLWFRDPAAGGGLTNLSDGLLVTICP